VATGDSGCEAYTAIAWGVGLSHERLDIAGAEGFHSPEGNMCGTAMRGAVALAESKATSRAKGLHRNLGGLGSDRQMLRERDGPHWWLSALPCSADQRKEHLTVFEGIPRYRVTFNDRLAPAERFVTIVHELDRQAFGSH
jgi:hypothetical protein